VVTEESAALVSSTMERHGVHWGEIAVSPEGPGRDRLVSQKQKVGT